MVQPANLTPTGYQKIATSQFEKYMKFLDIHYKDWTCDVVTNEKGYEIRWAVKLLMPSATTAGDIELPIASKFFFYSDVTHHSFLRMFTQVIGTHLHPRASLFHWVLMQIKYYGLGDDVHDNLLEILLRGALATLIMSGVKRVDLLNAFCEQIHFDYNIARVMSILQGRERKKHK